MPRLDVLPLAQRRIWDELVDLPDHFVLYGGTAVALHLGHRQSVDFDFFGFQTFDPDDLLGRLTVLAKAEVLQRDADTLTCLVDRGAPVQLSFFGVPALRRVESPVSAGPVGVNVASLVDLAGTKASVIQKRAEVRDYVDMGALLDHGVTLDTALGAARAIYGAVFNPQITLKALTYFDDGDLASLPRSLRHQLQDAAKDVDLDRLPLLEVQP